MSAKHITLSLTQVTFSSSITLLLSSYPHFQQVVPPFKQLPKPKFGYHPSLSCSVTPDPMPTITKPLWIYLLKIICLRSFLLFPMDVTLLTSAPQSIVYIAFSMQSHRGIPLPECFSSFSGALPTSPASFLAFSHHAPHILVILRETYSWLSRQNNIRGYC